jgi:hypothetical protein
MFNWIEKVCMVIGFLAFCGMVFMAAFSTYHLCKADLETQQNLVQVDVDQVKIKQQTAQLKEDKLELYKALSSCNFLRKMEKLPLNQVEMDLFKAVTTYYNSEAEVTEALEKYKAK